MKKIRSTGRPLRLEALEERRMLAVFTVDDSFAADDPAAHQFTTIQAAVDAAAAGDTIDLRPGTYAENVVVDKQLKIKGAEAPLASFNDPNVASIVDPVDDSTADSPGIAFDLQADGVEIEGFTIRESGDNVDPNGTIGIRTSASHAGYEIEENVIEGHTIGIYLNSATSTTSTPAKTKVEDNIIRDNNRAGTNSGNGIFSDQGLQNAEIEDNQFTGANSTASIKIIGGDGETATLQSDIEITDNDFHDTTGAGIYFENVVDSLIDDNDLTNIARSGIQLNGGNERVTIKRNDLESPGTDNLYGIILSDELSIGANQNNIIKRNHITNAGLTGIEIHDSSLNIIKRNKIEGSKGGALTNPADGNGISLEHADNNILKHNIVKNNARHGIFINDEDDPSTGNTLIENKSKDNNTANVDGFDYDDETTGGTGPSNTQNTYDDNRGGTENVGGLIDVFI
jgi:parallel beta-helix repeat protein